MGAGGKASRQESRHRLAQLDGLRGLAALMVALSHYTLAFQPALLGGGEKIAHFEASIAISHSALIFLFNPEVGVTIFFVLSGFVLASSVTRRPAGFIELAIRRWVRLSLPILGTCLLIWPLAEARLFYAVQAAPLAKSDWLAMNFARIAYENHDLLLLVWQSTVDIFLRSRNVYNAALWTMPIEFWGSIALFAAYSLMPRVMARRGWGGALALAALAMVWRTDYFGFPCGIALFEARRWVAGLSPERRSALIRFANPLGCALLIAGVLLGGLPFDVDLPAHGPYARLIVTLAAYVDRPFLLVHRIGAVPIVAATLLWQPMQRVLLTRPLQYLGRVSFMVYLCHVPLIASLISASLLSLAPRVGYNPATALLLPVYLVVLVGLADVTTRAFDLPAIRLSGVVGSVAGAWSRMLSRRLHLSTAT